MMNCTDCERLLEEHLDGELAARDAAETEAHLAACEACADARDALVSEQRLYAAYVRPVEVSPQLWNGVEARINEKTNGGDVGLLQRVYAWFAPLLTAPRFSPALTAALVLVAIALTVGVMKLNGSHEQSKDEIARDAQLNADRNARPAPPSNTGATPQPAQGSTPENAVENPMGEKASKPETNDNTKTNENAEPKPSPQTRKSPANEQRRRVVPELKDGAQMQQANNVATRPGQPTPEQLIADAEQRYIAAINLLQRDVASRRTRLDAQTTARFDESLAAIDRSIAETRRAVQQHAGDPIAAQYMLSAYAKKVEVLREMAHLQQ